MKLYFANTSPYARKARMTVIEKALEDRVEAIFQNPFDDSPELKTANPLGKVPALVTDTGEAIFDSRVICAYLDTLVGRPRLYPTGDALWSARVGETMADGILDAAFATVMERRRPEAQQSSDWIGRWRASLDRTFTAIEAELAKGGSRFDGDLTIAHIALGAALGYLDFRLPDIDWRTGNDHLAAWYHTFSTRDAMQRTAPPAT